jgi:3-hydroxyisobutyrate dehydrogenase-like beta-hydroxyacid dehydrogenase
VLRAWANPLSDLVFEDGGSRSDEAILEAVIPVDEIEAKLAEHMRPLIASLFERFGAAMAIKLANNALAIGTCASLLEVRAVARAYGADMEALMAVCRNGTANSCVVQAWDWLAANIESLSALALKDGGFCRAAAVVKEAPTPRDRSLSRQGLEAGRRGDG